MRVLSIQSHVAYGHVGNSAAVFPLQRLGHDVWAVNTVEFSNHTGYGAWKGRTATPGQIGDILDGIAALGILGQCDAVLTGYLGDQTLGDVVLRAVARVRAANPRAVWCCDPVIGDVDSGVFVRAGIPEFFRDRALPSADIATPNHFELELLTGRRVRTLADALAAARTLVAGRVGAIALVTSLRRDDAPSDSIEMLAVAADAAWLVATPIIDFPIPLNGTGDMVAALFLAHWQPRRDVPAALEATAAAIFAVLETTLDGGGRELALVAAQDRFVAPPRRFPARRVDDGTPS